MFTPYPKMIEKKRDLSLVINDQDNEFDNKKLTSYYSILVKMNPTLDKNFSIKKYVKVS